MLPKYSNRKFIIGAIFGVIALIYIIKLFSIQVMDSRYKISAESNVFRNHRLPA